jgi:RNA polymerase sigma factor (sigma-70 family)
LPPSENEKEIRLLKSDFGRLILRYQGTIRLIVGKYVTSGMFRQSEIEDIVQTVNDLLLERMPQIRSHYSGSTLLKTYLSSIIRNICLKEFRTRRRAPRNIPLVEEDVGGPDGSSDRALIREETERFRKILGMYRGQLPKLLICLKLYFHLSISRQDVLAWYPGCSKRDLDFMLKAFGGSYDEIPEASVFRLFTRVANKAEKRQNRAQTVQKWTNRHINEILGLLNGDSPASAHDRETLKILLEDYARPFLQV